MVGSAIYTGTYEFGEYFNVFNAIVVVVFFLFYFITENIS